MNDAEQRLRELRARVSFLEMFASLLKNTFWILLVLWILAALMTWAGRQP